MNELLDEKEKLQEEASEKSDATALGKMESTAVSQAESNSNIIMTVGDGSPQPGHNMTVMTAGLTSSPNAGQHAPSARVSVKIKYPPNWKKDKHFKDGDIKVVAPETADQFIQAGIATIVDPSKPE